MRARDRPAIDGEEWAWSAIKNKQRWSIKAVEHCPGRTRAWGLGGRDAAPCQRVYAPGQQLTDGVWYPAHGETWAHVWPQERQSLGKAYTPAIERAHSKTRYPLARMTRQTHIG